MWARAGAAGAPQSSMHESRHRFHSHPAVDRCEQKSLWARGNKNQTQRTGQGGLDEMREPEARIRTPPAIA